MSCPSANQGSYGGKKLDFVTALRYERSIGFSPPRVGCHRSGFDQRTKSEAAKNFEVSGIPKPVLVAADGTILATEVDLRGENLDATLAKVFGGEKMGAK